MSTPAPDDAPVTRATLLFRNVSSDMLALLSPQRLPRRREHLLPESADRVVHAAVGRSEWVDHDLADARAAESHHALPDLLDGTGQGESVDHAVGDERQER